ncbi:DUF6622 family protein [Shewanella benthica]|uniref:Uncharacterized protein n=1 Tax=Shewanella benthica KT99 TaxID=314608 RepID=A9DF86_9GAMM|nr:DUF6622 family protein [Shewanella benthica]EDP99994.1 hypothetical protein KT99_16916 [Shewanella benthica KT99]
MQLDSLSQALLEPLSQTFSQTPIWVFILFIALFGLGYSQSRQRRVSRVRAFIFPLVMSVFSLISLNTLVSSRGNEMLVFGLASWLAGLLLVFILVMVYQTGNRNSHGESWEGVVYVKQHDIFCLGW